MLALCGKLKAELEEVGTSEHGPAAFFNYSTWEDDVSPPRQRSKHFGTQLKSTLISDRQNRHAGDVDTAPNHACSETMYGLPDCWPEVGTPCSLAVQKSQINQR